MALLPRKALLAVAAVVDVALHARGRPVSARTLAARHDLPPRHLEPLLQALVHENILSGVRGPRGGYSLARPPQKVTVAEVLRAAGTVDEGADPNASRSMLLRDVIVPALAAAVQAFAMALDKVSIADLVDRAEQLSASKEQPDTRNP
jgi:Rrf2 family protein